MLREIQVRHRLIWGVVGGLLLALLVITGIVYVIVRNALQESVQQQVLNLTKTKVAEIDGFFREVGEIPIVLANASSVDEENDEMLLRARIREMLTHNPAVYGSTVAFEPYAFYSDQKYFSPYYSRTPDRQQLNYVQLGTDDYVYFRDWEWYTGPRDTEGLYWSLPYFDEGAGDIWMVTASFPVVRDGDFTGVATIDVPIDNIKQSLGDLQVGESGYVLMFDPSGGIIGTSGIEGLLEDATVQDLVAEVNSPELDALLQTIMAGKEGIQKVPDAFGGSGTLWATYAVVPSTEWHVVVFVSESEMLIPVTRVLLTTLGVSLLGLVALSGLMFLISRTITQPIDTLRTEALAISEGDFARRVPVEGRDEITALSQAFNKMAEEVESLLESLEARVMERTAKLRAAAEVSRATTSFLDPDALLAEVVDLVRQRFDLYYVALFLVGEDGQYAVLRAGTGDAGREMMARNHKLLVGGESMIGQCVENADARIMLGFGEAALRFDNPFLPETRSEMALPLRSRGRVIGAMSVQSTEPGAFDETDISVMQTMADQVATAIDNAQLFSQVQESLASARRAYGELSRESWSTLMRTRSNRGYRFEGKDILEISELSVQEGASGDDALPELTIPVTVRGHKIGRLRAHKTSEAEVWSSDEVTLLKSLTEQLDLALDSARLYQDTQRRALRERLISEAADKMRRATDMKALIRTTLEEMSAAVGISGAFVQLAPGSDAVADGVDSEVSAVPDVEAHDTPEEE